MDCILDVSAEELEYFSEDYSIKIIPNFHLAVLNLISGPIGPLKPNMESLVPLWFAIQLKKSRKCKLVLPPFLDEDYLSKAIKEEKDNQNALGQNLDFKLFDFFKSFEKK